MRLTAAAMFEQDMDPVLVAHQLRVSAKSVYQWRRDRRVDAMRPRPASVCDATVQRIDRVRRAIVP